MVIEDGLTLEDRRENLPSNKPWQLTGRLRRRAACAIIRPARG